MSVGLIHKSGHKIALAITGGGTEIIGELLRHGGGSSTVLECVVPYSNDSMVRFLGVPTSSKFVSQEMALMMAGTIYKNNFHESYDLIGIGVTCSLVKAEKERAGRKHECCVCVMDKWGHTFYEIKVKGKTREEQENNISQDLLKIIADRCGVFSFRKEEYYDLVTNSVSTLVDSKGDYPIEVIFPGSFNPIHDQHLNIVRAAAKKTGKKVWLEVSVENFDKGIMDYYGAFSDRVNYLHNEIQKHDDIAGVVYTDSMYFVEKSNIFPRRTFVVGYDTLDRLNQDSSRKIDLDLIESNRCEFLAVHRIINGESSKGKEQGFRPALLRITEFLDIEPSALSSREIRDAKSN